MITIMTSVSLYTRIFTSLNFQSDVAKSHKCGAIRASTAGICHRHYSLRIASGCVATAVIGVEKGAVGSDSLINCQLDPRDKRSWVLIQMPSFKD